MLEIIKFEKDSVGSNGDNMQQKPAEGTKRCKNNDKHHEFKMYRPLRMWYDFNGDCQYKNERIGRYFKRKFKKWKKKKDLRFIEKSEGARVR